MRKIAAALVLCSWSVVAHAAVSKEIAPFVKYDQPLIALTHVRVIDGTGAAAKGDQTIVIRNGKIEAIRPASDAIPEGAQVIDLTGHSVLPGLVGMHDHMYYIARPNQDAEGHSEPPLIIPQMTFSASRLYLANGVTTIRTAGSVEPYADLNLKRAPAAWYGGIQYSF